MAPTSAEKQKRYRDRIKDSSRWSAFKEADRGRKNEQRKNLSCSKRKTLCHRQRNASKKYRQKKQRHEVTVATPIASPISPSSTADQSFLSLFSTRQSFGKARKKALSGLPKSPKKRKALVFHLAHLEGLPFP
jgi:hypothetical protein